MRCKASSAEKGNCVLVYKHGPNYCEKCKLRGTDAHTELLKPKLEELKRNSP